MFNASRMSFAVPYFRVWEKKSGFKSDEFIAPSQIFCGINRIFTSPGGIPPIPRNRPRPSRRNPIWLRGMRIYLGPKLHCKDTDDNLCALVNHKRDFRAKTMGAPSPPSQGRSIFYPDTLPGKLFSIRGKARDP